MVRGALQAELDLFFKQLSQSDISEREVTKAAFSKARKQLKYQAFIELNQNLCNTVIDHSDARWNGFRICAVDGSVLNLPNQPALREHFDPKATGRPQARASQLYDVLNHITLDATLSPMKTGERSLALDHLKHSQRQDLILYDRGYPAFYLFAAHHQKGRHFCIRSPWNLYNETRDFHVSGKAEQWVTITPTSDAIKACQKQGLPIEPVEVRLVRVELSSHETEILITSVNNLPADSFKALYHLRWGVEEDYKMIKSRLQVEQFSGLSVEAVQQDFHAKVLSKNLASVLARSAQNLVEKDTVNHRHAYRVNGTMVLSKLKEVLPRWLSGQDMGTCFLSRFLKMLSCYREAIRQNRQYERKKGRPKMYNTSYKTVL